MKEIRVALIGTGTISKQHMDRYAKLPNVKLVAACDINKTRLESFGANYQVANLYTDYRELLKRDDIDSVDVCLHNNLHLPMSLEVLKAGKNCYCEKPMAGSYADAKTLYDASKTLGRELAVHLDNIFYRQSRLGKKMIEDGDLGKVYHARSVGLRRRGRPGLDMPLAPEFISSKWAGHGALYDMGVYHISQILYMMGLPKLERVSGQTYQGVDYKGRPASEAGMEVEELGIGFAKYTGGITFDIIESWAMQMDDIGPAYIVGNKGGLKLTQDPGFMGRPVPGLKFFTEMGGRDVNIDLNLGGNMMADMSDPKEHFYGEDQDNWIGYLAGEIEQRVDTPLIALQTMLVSEGIFLSSMLGREVTADEIEALSESNAMKTQETEWGTFTYSI